jgi:acyl-CoA dehydrogenase
MSDYDVEEVDWLPFTLRRSQKYQGAVGLNWYTPDPTLPAPMSTTSSPSSLHSRSRIRGSGVCPLGFPRV